MVHTFVYLFLLIQLFCVSLIDIRYKKISNQWFMLNGLLFIAFLYMFPHDYVFTPEKVMYGAVFLVVGFVLYLMKFMGGGDSKYLFSLFLLIPQEWSDFAFYSLFLCTLVIGGFVIFLSLVKNFEKIIYNLRIGHAAGVKACFDNKFPYAPVIFMSWMVLGCQLYLMKQY